MTDQVHRGNCTLTRPVVLLPKEGTMTPFRIDMHSHYYGGALPDLLRRRSTYPCLQRLADGTESMLAMNGAFPFSAAYHDPATGLAQMDAAGLTHRMITFPGALGVDLLPPEAGTVISAFNTHLADLGAATHGRLIGLAGLPLADIPAAIRETARIRDLGLPGIILPGNYFSSQTSAAPLRPILAEASRVGALIMIHPGLTLGQPAPVLSPDHPQYRVSALDLQSQIAQTALTVILSDMLDLYPGIRFQIVNLGGTLPFIFERLESIARHRNPTAPFPTQRLRALWYDCASLGPRALELAVDLVGADRVMLGSDYPIFNENPVTTVETSRLTGAQKTQVLGETAAALLAGLGVGPRA
jgi:aminocarboxymuconate-semialdehyde decarboxylase